MIMKEEAEQKLEEMEKIKALLGTLKDLERNIKAMNGIELPIQTNTDIINMRSLNLRLTAKLNLEKERMIDELCDELAIKREP